MSIGVVSRSSMPLYVLTSGGEKTAPYLIEAKVEY
jgi:hypothetical protein